MAGSDEFPFRIDGRISDIGNIGPEAFGVVVGGRRPLVLPNLPAGIDPQIRLGGIATDEYLGTRCHLKL